MSSAEDSKPVAADVSGEPAKSPRRKSNVATDMRVELMYEGRPVTRDDPLTPGEIDFLEFLVRGTVAELVERRRVGVTNASAPAATPAAPQRPRPTTRRGKR